MRSNKIREIKMFCRSF
uniref:Uncharacterized protein n=1 Tax=Arundo donax TaxID=35708 RepID=A0A0A8YS36_ARUDO